MRRPEITYEKMEKYLGCPHFAQDAAEEMEIMIKYEGYIARQEKAIEKAARMENEKIPAGIDFLHMEGITMEARQKLDKIRPLSLGQAARISGVSPADMTVLMVFLKQHKGEYR